jgi:UDP-N-acetylmuramoyl-L-alanyl-D-glutamate--2,6-diaminopimelate ligase
MKPNLDRAGISLRDVLTSARFVQAPDVRVTACCTSPEECSPGDLFVAVTAANSDGHDWADEAVRRGASAVLAERLLPVSGPQVVVEDSREALGEICQALVGRPSDSLRTIGVTGTSGKTVTSMLVASVLEAAGQAVGVTSSIGYSDSVDQVSAKATTPHAPLLAKWLSRMTEAGCTSAVLELSSRALAERRAAGVAFDAAVMTNLREAHLSLHGSTDNYRRAKERLLSMLKPGGFAVLNADDEGSTELLTRLDAPVLTFGLQSDADVTGEIIERQRSEQTFLLTAGNETVPVRTQMIGDYHVANCLAAAAVGLTLGIDAPTIARGLEAVERVPGRLERLECGQKFGVFVDSARTPEQLARTLRTLRKNTAGRLICVFGAPGGRNKKDRAELGRVAERSCDLPIITSNDPRHEEPLQIAHDILDGFQRPAKGHVLPGRTEAICFALLTAMPGDCVVITGKGDREEQIVGKRRLTHDDRAIARAWLYRQGGEELRKPMFRVVG